MSEQSDRDRELAELRDYAIRQVVGLVVTAAAAAGIAYVIKHRYAAEQLARRARDYVQHKRDPNRARDARAVAELQREISIYEHAQAAGPPRPGRRPGLYERP